MVNVTLLPLYTQGRTPVPIELEGWVGPSTSLVVLEKQKISCPFSPNVLMIFTFHVRNI
jgi:hypothetical protein